METVINVINTVTYYIDVLTAKANVFMGLFGIVGLVGLGLLALSILFLIFQASNFNPILPAVIAVLISICLLIGGFLTSPDPNAEPEPERYKSARIMTAEKQRILDAYAAAREAGDAAPPET